MNLHVRERLGVWVARHLRAVIYWMLALNVTAFCYLAVGRGEMAALAFLPSMSLLAAIGDSLAPRSDAA